MGKLLLLAMVVLPVQGLRMGVIKGEESDDQWHVDDEPGSFAPESKTVGFDQVRDPTPTTDCLQNKRVLFMGDSTMQEIVWRTLVLVNGTAGQKTTNVPITQCHNDDCMERSGNNLKSAKAHARCATVGGDACMAQMSEVQKKKFDLEFLWSGGLNPTDNFGGLNDAIYNEKWVNMLENAKARGPFDAVIFSAGNHDNVNKNYQTALNDVLPMIEPLSEKRVFLQTSSGNPREKEMQAINEKTLEGRNWNMVHRAEFHPATHCAHISYKNSKKPSWVYKWAPGCDGVVNAMVQAIC